MPHTLRLVVSLAVLGTASPGLARMTQGPFLDTQATGPAVIQPTGHVPQPDETLARRRTEGELIAPIPENILGGMFVVKADFFDEQRVLAGADAPPAAEVPKDQSHPSVMGADLIFLPHMAEGSPKLFLGAGRYGHLRFHDDQKPMSEYIVGADIVKADMPLKLVFSDTDDSVTRVLVRYRQFPGFHKWLLLVGHRIDRANGLYLDVEIPSHVYAGWSSHDQVWTYYGGIRWASREYPFNDRVNGESQTGWMDGYEQTFLIAVRRELFHPVYVTLEAGVESEWMRFVDEHGKELDAYQTRNAPWAKIALETWFKNP